MRHKIIGVCDMCGAADIFCKGKCQACYSKMLRNTEKGKSAMKMYNLTKGRDATKRYRERQKLLKPPKPPKPYCECGAPSVAKGLCHRCYCRYYQRRKYKYKPRSKVSNVVDSEDLFLRVLTEVKKGFTISGACRKLKIDRGKLYHVITPLQKSELNAYKSIGCIEDNDDLCP